MGMLCVAQHRQAWGSQAYKNRFIRRFTMNTDASVSSRWTFQENRLSNNSVNKFVKLGLNISELLLHERVCAIKIYRSSDGDSLSRQTQNIFVYS